MVLFRIFPFRFWYSEYKLKDEALVNVMPCDAFERSREITREKKRAVKIEMEKRDQLRK